MKIAMTTVGSTGDLTPFLALAIKLKKRGHEVKICTHLIFEEKVKSFGIDFSPCGPHITMDEFEYWSHKIFKDLNPMKQLRSLFEILLGKEPEKRFKECLEATKGCDLVISHHIDFAGQEAARKNNIPWINVFLFPGVFPTKHYFNLPKGIGNYGKTLNSLLWKVLVFFIKKCVFPTVIDRFKSFGCKNTDFSFFRTSPYKNFIATSEFIAETQSDLPPNVEVVGNWFMDEADYSPPHDLEEFIKQGTPPVVVSFGSMMVEEGRKTAQIVLNAIKLSGQRAIIQKGWGNLEFESPSENIKFVDYVPHTYLLPHALCLVHHCGAGTTASACRAGIPSIPVPHGVDQFAWAHWLKQRGLAPKAIDRKYLNAKVLAERIKEVANKSSYSQKAKMISQKIIHENGIKKTIKVIENFQNKESLAG